MKERDRKKRIRLHAEYIQSGRQEGSLKDCLGDALSEEIASIKGPVDSGLKRGIFCIDLGARLVTLEENGTIHVEYPVKDSFRNAMGNLQGGLMASLIDNAMGILVTPVYGHFLTMNLEINYFLPVSRDYDRLRIVAEIVKPGKRTKYLRAAVYRSDGKLAALAGSNVMMVREEK